MTDQGAQSDAVSLLTSDHRTVDGLFDSYEGLGADASDRKRELVDEMIRELSVHAAVEEQVLYPFIRDQVPDGAQLADDGLEEHQGAKELLAQLEDMDAADSDFDATVGRLISDVRHHVEEEEGDFFPKLQQAASEEQLFDLGRRLAEAKSSAPTRPHPHAPSSRAGHLVADPAASVVDRARDAATKDER